MISASFASLVASSSDSENWIDFVCLVAILGFGLVIGVVGCQRSSYPRNATPEPEKSKSRVVVYGDGNAIGVPADFESANPR